MIFDKEEIKKRLPHRAPFLFVDYVDEFIKGKSIVAKLEVCSDMEFFKGHFPKKAIMPGVLMVEALAQTSGLIISFSEMSEGEIFYLASNNIKFLDVVEPDVTLELRSSLERSFNGLYQFSVEAIAKGKTAARGVIVLSVAK